MTAGKLFPLALMDAPLMLLSTASLDELPAGLYTQSLGARGACHVNVNCSCLRLLMAFEFRVQGLGLRDLLLPQ